jgi:hypothetical protein
MPEMMRQDAQECRGARRDSSIGRLAAVGNPGLSERMSLSRSDSWRIMVFKGHSSKKNA